MCVCVGGDALFHMPQCAETVCWVCYAHMVRFLMHYSSPVICFFYGQRCVSSVQSGSFGANESHIPLMS